MVISTLCNTVYIAIFLHLSIFLLSTDHKKKPSKQLRSSCNTPDVSLTPSRFFSTGRVLAFSSVGYRNEGGSDDHVFCGLQPSWKSKIHGAHGHHSAVRIRLLQKMVSRPTLKNTLYLSCSNEDVHSPAASQRVERKNCETRVIRATGTPGFVSFGSVCNPLQVRTRSSPRHRFSFPPSSSSCADYPQTAPPIPRSHSPPILRSHSKLRPTVFTEFSELARKTAAAFVPSSTDVLSAPKTNEVEELSSSLSDVSRLPPVVDCGLGYPNWTPPRFVLDAAARSIADPHKHQYCRTAGLPELVTTLADRYGTHMHRDVDPFTEVAITSGASEGLYLAIRLALRQRRASNRRLACSEDIDGFGRGQVVSGEVVMFEPYFNLYDSQVRQAGGVPVYVPLVWKEAPGWNACENKLSAAFTSWKNVGNSNHKSGKVEMAGVNPGEEERKSGCRRNTGEWTFDLDALRAKINENTRLLILNSPHNPTGKVFSRKEMEAMRDILGDFPDVMVVHDEVYKYMIFDPLEEETNVTPQLLRRSSSSSLQNSVDEPAQHVSQPAVSLAPSHANGHTHFASLSPDMWDRTLTISSAGKTFSLTGWSVGWVVGPSHLIESIQLDLPQMHFCTATPLQHAMSDVLRDADLPFRGFDSYYEWLQHKCSEKQKRVGEVLRGAGIEPKQGSAGYFLIGDIGDVDVPHKYLNEQPESCAEMTRTWAFCRWMTVEGGVVALPMSAFYSRQNQTMADKLIRVAVCKTEETITHLEQRLNYWRNRSRAVSPAAS
eukprot:GHVQ01005155.1.p1 GENE.GHVQ01005155.1~~GHVQ01005155.1.p1  ORF type:complete len:772 (+),score=86.37 GHVQ01005155.1:142-2457(+)